MQLEDVDVSTESVAMHHIVGVCHPLSEQLCFEK